MLVRKTLSLSNVALKMDGATGKFAGYASVFGGVDSYGDTIVKGAFLDTLRTNGLPKMFWNHDWDMPIGKWDVAREDDHGLWVEGSLTPGLSLSEDVKAALSHGTIDGLSIGGYLKRGDYEETEEGRRITKWTSLMEVSPVVFPADASARIDPDTVKSGEVLALIDGIESIRDFENFLRDAGGLSKGAALALTARAKEVLTARDSQPEPTDAKALALVAERLQRMTAAFR